MPVRPGLPLEGEEQERTREGGREAGRELWRAAISLR